MTSSLIRLSPPCTVTTLALALALGSTGCPMPDEPPGDGSTTDPTTTATTSTDPDTGSSTASEDGPADSTGTTSTDEGTDTTGDPEVGPEAELLGLLPGLWVAPVTSTTSVGDFPIMSMDIRPADDTTLFSRVDLDADNNLRFAFAIEDHDGPTLVFRNGGYFLGFLRDTRTTLVEHDAVARTWRFCAIAGGCEYVEATFALPESDVLQLSTNVMGRPHMFWEGILREERVLEGDFPYDPDPGAADDPFPQMPTLRVTLMWTDPVAAPVDAWVVLSTTECGVVPGSCYPSRFIRATAPVGATSVELALEQIHAGDYFATAMLDHNGNLAGTLFPDSGDLVSLPNADVEVGQRGESTAMIALVIEL